MPLLTIFRLGLRQFAAGLLSVLVLGILNRVMRVENRNNTISEISTRGTALASHVCA